MRYRLDPDFRKQPNEGKPYCCNCQKPIKNVEAAARVIVNWNTWEAQDFDWVEQPLYVLDPKGVVTLELLGPDCAKRARIDNQPNGEE